MTEMLESPTRMLKHLLTIFQMLKKINRGTESIKIPNQMLGIKTTMSEMKNIPDGINCKLDKA